MKRLHALLILAAVGLVKLLEPIVMVRFGALFCSRLGHLAGNTECYLCERDAGLHKKRGRTLDIWTPQGKPANEYLLKMFARVMPISRWAGLVHAAGSRLPQWNERHSFSDSQWGRDIHNLMEKTPPHLKLTRAERRRGEREQRSLGIPDGAKWVCIIARDPLYLKAMAPGSDFSYHGFRDSDINHYRQAAVALMERGYWVIRMGAFVDQPMRLQAPQFIDYAVSGRRSDFLDVYLGANCAFCISNGTGFDGIPMIFRRPIVFVNEAPFEYLSTWMKDSLAIWKHHYRDGKRLGPAEIVAAGAGLFSRSDEYEKAGIALMENTDEEIKDVALEMANRLEGKPPVGDGLEEMDEALQRSFWLAYPRSVSKHNGLPLHGEVTMRIGARFLRTYE